MRAILIDPFAKAVTETDFNGDYRHIYELIKCQTFDVARVTPGNVIFVDDEGLYVPDQAFFEWQGYHEPLAGRGLILGVDRSNEVSTIIPLEVARSMVTWRNIRFKGTVTTSRAGEIFGRPATVISSVAKFEDKLT